MPNRIQIPVALPQICQILAVHELIGRRNASVGQKLLRRGWNSGPERSPGLTGILPDLSGGEASDPTTREVAPNGSRSISQGEIGLSHSPPNQGIVIDRNLKRSLLVSFCIRWRDSRISASFISGVLSNFC